MPGTKTAKGAAKKTAKPVKQTKSAKAGKGSPKTAAPSKSAPKEAPAKTPKRLGVLSAAHQVLGASPEPMTCQELIEAMATQKLWSSPNGKTPAQTLYAAVIREIKAKGAESRFAKTERGKFEARKA